LSLLLKESVRRLIPRWRYSFATILSAEHTGLADRRAIDSSELGPFEQAERDFNHKPGLRTAADFVAAAVAYMEPLRARAAADYLLAREVQLVPNVVGQARWVAAGTPPERAARGASDDAEFSASSVVARKVVASRRQQVQAWPHDTIAWLDLARAYAVVGQLEKAERAMRVALQLSPDHRVVLRLAARLALHAGRPEEAYVRIARHPRTPHDPWLLSAELAFAQILGRTPRFTRAATTMLAENTYSPSHTSELAGALATLELMAGKHRPARSLFKESLRKPTENAVAQAEWSVRTDPSLIIPASALELPGSHEANFWRARRVGDWRHSVSYARAWWNDEPYSSRPAVIGSSVAITALGAFTVAEELARAGLKADPTDHSILNNLAVALAFQNRLPEAREVFSRISKPFRNQLPEFVADATRGLIAFRSGDIEAGRYWYGLADSGAPDGDSRRVVLLFWAGEEADARRGRKLIERAAPEPERSYDPIIASLRSAVIARTQVSHARKAQIPALPSSSSYSPHTGALAYEDIPRLELKRD